MPIQHRDIPEEELHEPKGVSLASGNTVYVANGQGSGTWKLLNTDNITGLGSQQGAEGRMILSDGQGGFKYSPYAAYGSLVINNNTTAFPVTAATDATLNSNTDYKVITGTGAPWEADLTYETGVTTDGISPVHDGIYKIETWIDISQFPTNTSKLAIKYVVNGNQYSLSKITVKSNSNGDAGNISGFGLAQLSAGDIVRIAVASTEAGNITFESGNLTLTLVRAL